MKHDFAAHRAFLEDEFAQAAWDDATGMDPAALERSMWRIVEENPDLPAILLRARVFSFIAENARLAYNPHTPFHGKIDLGIHYGESAGQGVYYRLYERLNGDTLGREIPEMMEKKRQAEAMGLGFGVADFWHTMPDWARVLRLGFAGMERELLSARAEKEAAGVLTREQGWFYESALTHVRACRTYIRRLRALGEAHGEAAWCRCLERIEAHPPADLYEALQTALVYMELEEMGVERARTLGRVDQLWQPYLDAMLARGETAEDAREYLRYFFMRFQAARRFAAQPFAIGGADVDGRDIHTPMTDLILDVYEELKVRNPKIHAIVHPGTDRRLLRRLLSLIREGASAIAFISQDAVVRAYGRIGIGPEEAVSFCPFGCYEPMLPGLEDAMIGASWCNMAKAVELAMNGGADPRTGARLTRPTPLDFDSFDAFYRAVKAQIRDIIAFIRSAIEAELPFTMRINPSPLYSASIASCVARGRDVFDSGSMKYHNVSIKCFGIATLTDAVMAVKRLVFERRLVSFAALRDILNADWAGHEALRQAALSDPCKFGNHCAEADEIARDLYRCMAEEIVGRPVAGWGGKYRMGGDSITNCISFARRMGATPDGRRAGEPVSKNFSATAGMERGGVTAWLESLFALDWADFCDAAVADVALHASAVQGEAGLDAMEAMLRVALEKGVFAVQGNVLDREALLDARVHPEKYADLQVRLCGWNEYWINMDRTKQDAFLKRLEAV